MAKFSNAKFSNAKVFTQLNASQGFWQMKLDEESSYLTTFTTPLVGSAINIYRLELNPHMRCTTRPYHRGFTVYQM